MPKDDKQDIDNPANALKNAKVIETEDRVVAAPPRRVSSLLLIMVAILLFFTVAVGAGSALMLMRSNQMPHRGEMIIYGQRNMPFSNHMYIETSSSSSTTNSIISSGVVTSVNDSSFVIAGNGNQTTINTTGDTTYNTTNKKVSVNDSVIVAGAKSNGTITATDVRIMNF